MPCAHWVPVALGPSGSEQKLLAVEPGSSFQRGSGTLKKPTEILLLCVLKEHRRSFPALPPENASRLGPLLQGRKGSFLGSTSLGGKECISQKHNPVYDPANDSHKPRGKKSILKLVLGSRSPPNLLPRVRELTIRLKANISQWGDTLFVTNWL